MTRFFLTDQAEVVERPAEPVLLCLCCGVCFVLGYVPRQDGGGDGDAHA